MPKHPSRLRKNLFFSVLTSIIFLSTSVHAEQIVWSCDIEGYNLKALLTQHEPTQPKVCSIVVTRTYRKKVSSRTTWRAQNEIGFCQKKFDNKLAELKKDGWQCTEPQKIMTLTESTQPTTPPDSKSTSNSQPSKSSADSLTSSESKYVRHYSLIPYINFAKYEGEDNIGSKATVVSRSADPGLMITAGLTQLGQWDISALLGASYTDLKINSNVDTLDNEKQFLGDLSIEAIHPITNSLLGVIGVGAEKLLFIHRDSSTSKLSIEGLIVPELTLGLQWQAYESENFTWSPTLAAGYLARTSNDKVDAKEGNVYTAGLQVSRNSGFNPLVGGLYFQQRQQDTTLVKWSQSDVGFWLAWAL